MVFDRPLLLAFTLLLATPAWAEPSSAPTAAQKETARNLMHRGDQKLRGGDFEAALEAFEAADAIMGVPTTALAVGKARARLGYLVEATDALGRVRRYPKSAREPAVFTAAREEAALLDADLARRIPVVTITIEGPAEETPVTLVVDGVNQGSFLRGQPLRLNPGPHTLTFDGPGYHPAERTVSLEEEMVLALTVPLRADPSEVDDVDATRAEEAPADGAPHREVPSPVVPSPEPPSPWSTMAIASFAVGGAGLVAGAITGGLAMAETEALEDRCGGTRCPLGEVSAHDRIEALAHASNATFVVGGLGVAAGVTALVLELTRDEGADAARVTPLVGPMGAGVRVRF